MLILQLCREEEVGFVDLWRNFVGRTDMKSYLRMNSQQIGALVA